MPGFFPGRPGGEHDELLLDMIIARRALPPDAPREMHDLARMLAALAGPAEPGELTGEAAARAAFARFASPVSLSPAGRRPARRHRRSRRLRRPALSRTGLAVALAGAAAAVSVLAAYANLLPGPVQRLAHVAVAAPAPPQPSSTLHPGVGSLLSGSAGRKTPTSSPGPAAGVPHGSDSRHDHAQASQASRPAHRHWPGRRSTNPSCTLHPWPPGTQASNVPGLPAWWQMLGCHDSPGAPPSQVPPKLSIPSDQP